jgi:hypothetical protein
MANRIFLQPTQVPVVYTTTTELIAATVPTTISVVETFGYRTLGDGGGGLWQRVPQAAQVPQITSADGAFWQLVQGVTPAAVQFGAWVGSSPTGPVDSTAAVQSGIDWAIVSNQPLLIGPGLHWITRLTIPASVKIIGTGTIRQMANTTGHMLNITGNGTTVTIEGVTLDGNCTAQVANSPNRIIRSTAVGHASGTPATLVCTDVTFRNPCVAAIQVQSDNVVTTSERLEVTNCRFIDGLEGSAAPIYAPSDIAVTNGVQVSVTGCDFRATTAQAIGRCALVVANTAAAELVPKYSSIRFTGNDVTRRGYNVTSNLLGAVDLYIWAEDSIIANNRFSECTMSAIRWKSSGRRVKAIGNIITNTANGRVSISVNGSTVTGQVGDSHEVLFNTISGGTGDGISMSGMDVSGTAFSRGHRAIGNVVSNCAGVAISMSQQESPSSIDNLTTDGTIGVRMQQGRGTITMRGNKATAHSTYAFYADNNIADAVLQMQNNTADACTGTYAVFAEATTVQASSNVVANSVNGFRFGAGTGLTNLKVTDCQTVNLSGTFGFQVVGGVARLMMTSNDSAATTPLSEQSPVATARVVSGNSW